MTARKPKPKNIIKIKTTGTQIIQGNIMVFRDAEVPGRRWIRFDQKVADGEVKE